MLTGDDARKLEHESIRAFIQACGDCYLNADVLDFGCGRQPYRQMIEDAGGRYVGFDRPGFPANVGGETHGPAYPLDDQVWDVIVCTQILQYVPYPGDLLAKFHDALGQRGWLILTGPTNWPEVEAADLSRFTQTGIRQLLETVHFEIHELRSRASLLIDGFELSLGYQAIARVAP